MSQMPAPLRSGDDTERPVLLLEFGNEIPARTFDRILPPQSHAHRTVIDPLGFPGLADSVPTLAEQAAHWAESIIARPRAVLAYCSGAELAVLLAARLGVPQTSVLVFDPVLPAPGTPGELLLDLATGMDAALGPDEIPDIVGLPADEALAAAGSLLHSIVARTAPGLDADIVEELTVGQRAWLSFTLSAAAPRPRPHPPRFGHVLLGTDSAGAEVEAGSLHHTGLSSAELFGTSAVTPLVERLLMSPVATEIAQER
ncbi:hypothetical protein ACH4F6_32375 [Streptomyces sp. NPDC017936]|uniref:hypothetical protein n=1 Tax=Streptomyces sp. NPDC017936 TaxID=3365016 RepID=UPI0037A608B1